MHLKEKSTYSSTGGIKNDGYTANKCILNTIFEISIHPVYSNPSRIIVSLLFKGSYL